MTGIVFEYGESLIKYGCGGAPWQSGSSRLLYINHPESHLGYNFVHVRKPSSWPVKRHLFHKGPGLSDILLTEESAVFRPH